MPEVKSTAADGGEGAREERGEVQSMKECGLTSGARRKQGRLGKGPGYRRLSEANGPVGEDEEGGKVRRGYGGGPEGGDGRDDARDGAGEDAMEVPRELGESWGRRCW